MGTRSCIDSKNGLWKGAMWSIPVDSSRQHHQSSRKTNNKLDEEGLEVAICRHGILLRSLNMMRGEIFAVLAEGIVWQQEHTIHVYGCDLQILAILTKVALHCPELATLLDMKTLLSVMHAKAHRLKCEQEQTC